MSALICGNVFLGGTTVFAEEIGDYQLDEMVVTATRTEESNIKVASVVSVITADDIKKEKYFDHHRRIKRGSWYL